MKSQGFRACGRDKGAMKTDKFAVAPLTPSQHTPMFLGYLCCREIRTQRD